MVRLSLSRWLSILNHINRLQCLLGWRADGSRHPGFNSRSGRGFSAQLVQRAWYEIKFSNRCRGFACVLYKPWQAITLRNQGVWVVISVGREVTDRSEPRTTSTSPLHRLCCDHAGMAQLNSVHTVCLSDAVCISLTYGGVKRPHPKIHSRHVYKTTVTPTIRSHHAYKTAVTSTKQPSRLQFAAVTSTIHNLFCRRDGCEL